MSVFSLQVCLSTSCFSRLSVSSKRVMQSSARCSLLSANLIPLANFLVQTLRRCAAHKECLLCLAELPAAAPPGTASILLEAPLALSESEELPVRQRDQIWEDSCQQTHIGVRWA